MEGIVIVEELTGALHFTRSFSKRFDAHHPKLDRMNLGALLFALENFASSSITEAIESDLPPITFIQNARESIALAKSSGNGLLIALFTHPSVSSDLSKALLSRIAFHYDHGTDVETRLAVALNQAGRRFREACSRAIDDEINRLLDAFDFQVRENRGTTASLSPRFLLLYYSPSLRYKRKEGRPYDGGDDDEDERQDQSKEASLSAPTPTRGPAQPLQRLQKLMPSTRSLLPRHEVGKRVKKNAVANYSGPRSLHRYRLYEETGGSATPLTTLLRHPLFPETLVDTLRPIARVITTDEEHTPFMERIPHVVEWRNFPLPAVGEVASSEKKLRQSSDLRLWKRQGCVLAYSDCFQWNRDATAEKLSIMTLLDDIDHLVRCALRLTA